MHSLAHATTPSRSTACLGPGLGLGARARAKVRPRVRARVRDRVRVSGECVWSVRVRGGSRCAALALEVAIYPLTLALEAAIYPLTLALEVALASGLREAEAA